MWPCTCRFLARILGFAAAPGSLGAPAGQRSLEAAPAPWEGGDDDPALAPPSLVALAAVSQGQAVILRLQGGT